MLWIEITGTYKVESDYYPIRWDFCDIHCTKEYLVEGDFTRVAVAKHKVTKKKNKKKAKK